MDLPINFKLSAILIYIMGITWLINQIKRYKSDIKLYNHLKNNHELEFK